MADMDSGGAANRQNPGSLKRNKAPSNVVVRQPRSKITVSTGSRPSRRKTNVGSGGTSHYQKTVRRRATGGNNNSGGVRHTAPTPVATATSKTITPPAPPKPVPPKAGDYLKSDSVYQRQAAAYAQALAQFQADQGLSSTDYNTGYQSTLRDIGVARGDAQENLKNDFASRGMLQSSLYNEGLGELNTQYQNQTNDLNKQRTSFLDQLAQEAAKFKSEQGSQLTNAQQEALRRRAEKYNL